MENATLKPYPDYKPSGVDWLGDIPAHWDVRRIKTLSVVKRGASPRPIDNPMYFDENGEYAWVRISDVTASNHYLRETTQRLSEIGQDLSVKVEPGNLFLSIAGSVGKPIITSIKCCIHDGFVYFPYFKGDVEFLYRILSIGGPFAKLGKLGTQLNLNTNTVGNIYIDLPSTAEQAAIVRYLDHTDDRIRRAISAKERLIELLTEQRQAVIHRAVTRGLDPNVPLKASGVEWLGDVPKHWEVRRLRSLAHISTGSRDTINKDDDGKYSFFVRSQTVERINTWSFDGEAVLTAGDGVGVGRVFHYVNGKFDYHQRVYKFSDFRDVLGRFFYHYLATTLPLEVRQGTAKSTVDSLRLPMLQNLPVAVAPITEQLSVVHYLDKATADIDTAIDKAQRQIDLLREYRTRLIADVVTGQVDVRGAVVG